MMTRGEFIKEGKQRLSYLLQQIELEHGERKGSSSALDAAQIKLEWAKGEFLDFIYDALAQVQGSLVTPTRSAPGSEPVVPNGIAPSEREPRAHSPL